MSKSDDRRFYIFSPTKTLYLKTDSKDDRVAWIEALISAKSAYSLGSLSRKISFTPNDFSFSTERLRDRMHEEGLNEALIKDCEQIMLSEFQDYHRQLKLRYEEHFNLLGAYQKEFEVSIFMSKHSLSTFLGCTFSYPSRQIYYELWVIYSQNKLKELFIFVHHGFTVI